MPLKKLTPIIEKINIKREQTSNTFVIEGSDANKAFTTNLIPSFLLITLRGLKARSALNDLRAYSCYISMPITIKDKSIIETVTTNKSKQFHVLLI